MQSPVELSFTNVDPSPAVEERVNHRVGRLERLFDGITSCHVWIEASHLSQAPSRSRGKTVSYEVRIELRVPGTELAVSRKPGDQGAHKSLKVAVRDSFDAMEKQLKHYVGQLRRDVKSHPAPLQGKVVRLLLEHGFIATTDGQEIYFHAHSVAEDGFGALEIGAPVELTMVEGESAEGPQATTVTPIRPQQMRAQPR
jgi:cold shock CspA family protein/ribosome-associated translation inhibitor RaiA